MVIAELASALLKAVTYSVVSGVLMSALVDLERILAEIVFSNCTTG